MSAVPLLLKRRGAITEAIWRGHVALVDADGRLVASIGDPAAAVIYFRSAAKPLQAVAVCQDGADMAFGVTPAEVALMCASHLGEPGHVEAGASLLQRIDQSPDVLYQPAGLRHGCSGKHSGFLMLAAQHGWPAADYLDPNHPVQQLVLNRVASLCSKPVAEIKVARENCGAPTFGMPLAHLALGYARLAAPATLPQPVQAACRRVTAAMVAHPEMVRGTGSFCTRVGVAGQGALIGKWGATGVYAVALLKLGLGLAIKVECGLEQAAFEVAAEALVQLGVLHATAASQELAEFYRPPIVDVRGVERGFTEPASEFVLPQLVA